MKSQFPTNNLTRILLLSIGLAFSISAFHGCGSWWELEDLEKPKPEISKQEKRAIAKLIPRGKNNSVLLSFEAIEGEIKSLRGIAFEEHADPLVDSKDFRSALFEIQIEHLNPGQEAELVVGSDFFTTATEFWVHNPKRAPAWRAVNARALTKKQVYVDLIFRVKDGGAFDLDGEQNGKLTIIGGPRDSFWGYALGTLFIRFFGVFIVLIALMIGMIFFGKLAMGLKSAKKQPAPPTSNPPAKTPKTESCDDLPPTIAAAVALAIELESKRIATQITVEDPEAPRNPGPWTQQGRVLLMESRQNAYERTKR